MKEYLPNKEVLKSFPIFDIDCGVDKEKVLLFITYCYHPKSELSGIVNTIERRFKAAELSDFPKKKNKFVNDDIILGKNGIVNKMIIAYLKLFRNPSYSELKVYYDMFYSELENLKNSDETEIDTVDDKKKKADTRAKINSNIKLYSGKISELQYEFLSEDNSRELLSDLYDELLSEGLTSAPSPEIIAQKIKEGKPPLGSFNPYEIR